MQIPAWITILIGATIAAFGGYRVTLARSKDRPASYLGSKTADLVMGIVHILAGLFLIALGLGVIPALRGGR